jgi:hypothetical protein
VARLHQGLGLVELGARNEVIRLRSDVLMVCVFFEVYRADQGIPDPHDRFQRVSDLIALSWRLGVC